MKTLHECQQSAWDSIKASLKAAEQEIPESWRSAVNLMVIELYNSIKQPDAPKSAIEVKLAAWRKKLARWAVPLLVLGALWIGVQIGKGKDFSDFFTVVFIIGVAAIAWYLAEYGIKKK